MTYDVIYEDTKIGVLVPPSETSGAWMGIPYRYSRRLGWLPAQEIRIEDENPEKIRRAIVNGPLNILR